MKRIILTLAVVFAGFQAIALQEAQAQQIHQLTHYMTNDFAFNPAVAGSSDLFVAKAAYRKQWAGFNGSPSTTLFSIHGNLLENRSVGLGALLYNDATGPTKRFGIQLAYAYHLPIVENETYLGFGIAGSLMQYSINYDDLIAYDDNDPGLANNKQSKMGGDAHFGVYLKNKNYWAGLSINQLVAAKFTFDDVSTEDLISNDRHFYFGGGYTIHTSEKFAIEPALLIKMVKAAPVQAEINLRAFYLKQYWAGLSYRTQDAISILLGVDLDMGFNFAYSYDITTSELSKHGISGAHEITLGYNFDAFGRAK